MKKRWNIYSTIACAILILLVVCLVGIISARAYESEPYYQERMDKAHWMADCMRSLGWDQGTPGQQAALKECGYFWHSNNDARKELIAVKQQEAQRAAEEQKSNLVSLGTFTITHYCPCSICNGGYTGTATGAPLTPGETIAVDPSVIPYWSHVMINGHEYIAEDCGGDIKGHHIDLLVEDHSTALAKGTIKAEVFLVK